MPSLTQTRNADAILTDEMLARFAKRAPQYDRDNAFFADDFEELRQAGYLRIAVPQELGGAGLSLADVAQQQRRLGYHAAPTALAINMHLYWTGVAADLWRAGDKSLGMAARAGGGAAKCSRRATPNPATTSRSCCPRPKRSASKAGIDLRDGNHSAACLPCGPTWGSTGWTPPTRRSRRSCTPSCRAIRKATASKRPGTSSACGRPEATTPFSTASSYPIATSRVSCRPAPRESTTSSSRCSPGRSSDSATSIMGFRAGRSR